MPTFVQGKRKLVPALTEAIGDLVPGLIPRSVRCVNNSNQSMLSLLLHLFSHVFPFYLRSKRHVLFWVEVPARDLQQQTLRIWACFGFNCIITSWGHKQAQPLAYWDFIRMLQTPRMHSIPDSVSVRPKSQPLNWESPRITCQVGGLVSWSCLPGILNS